MMGVGRQEQDRDMRQRGKKPEYSLEIFVRWKSSQWGKSIRNPDLKWREKQPLCCVCPLKTSEFLGIAVLHIDAPIGHIPGWNINISVHKSKQVWSEFTKATPLLNSMLFDDWLSTFIMKVIPAILLHTLLSQFAAWTLPFIWSRSIFICHCSCHAWFEQPFIVSTHNFAVHNAPEDAPDAGCSFVSWFQSVLQFPHLLPRYFVYIAT